MRASPDTAKQKGNCDLIQQDLLETSVKLTQSWEGKGINKY